MHITLEPLHQNKPNSCRKHSLEVTVDWDFFFLMFSTVKHKLVWNIALRQLFTELRNKQTNNNKKKVVTDESDLHTHTAHILTRFMSGPLPKQQQQ